MEKTACHRSKAFFRFLPLAMLLVIFMTTTAAFSKNPYRKTFFESVYPQAQGTVLDTISGASHCGVCHYDFNGGGNRNHYGLLVEGTNKSASQIAALGTQDADGDGYDTDTEVLNLTFSNTPTFPGLAPADIAGVQNVNLADIQPYLVPSVGVDTTPPMVSVDYPNGLETVTGNSEVVILWTATDDQGVGGIDLFYSEDDGVNFTQIVLGTSNTGFYSWFPANRPTTQAVIKAIAVDNSGNAAEDVSDDVFTVESPVGGIAPTTLRDFDQPGTQPHEAGVLNDPGACKVCHGDYDKNVEPYSNWQGSLMSQASYDPLFRANMVIANQDAPDSGDLCLRCHFPRGWMQGRSVPTDGSAMLKDDHSGVACDLCHRLVDPTNQDGSPVEDTAILASLSNPGTWFGNGMYVVDPTGARRGPFANADSGHPALFSPFHQDAALCGTCHDVSNPAFDVQLDGSYLPNTFDAAATDFSPEIILPVERTYSEWLNSAYNTPGGIYSPYFGGNKTFVGICQDCHMQDVTGYGANPAITDAPERNDLPLHDITGGSTWLPTVLNKMYPVDANDVDIIAGADRARAMLQNAASISASQEELQVRVRVVNNTGHKLPTGYPEGRRIFLNVKFLDGTAAVISESAAYDYDTGELAHDAEAKIYHIEPGIDSTLAGVLGLPEGPSFHFVLNNKVYLDNRIPPQGFSNAAFESFGGPPVAYTYADGQYWDDTYYQIPAGAESAEVSLYYQSTSKEFVEFLRDENTTNSVGQEMYDLWNDNDKCPPELMAQTSITFSSPAADFDSDWDVDVDDLAIMAAAWCSSSTLCDISTPADGIVNYLDFAEFARYWLWGM